MNLELFTIGIDAPRDAIPRLPNYPAFLVRNHPEIVCDRVEPLMRAFGYGFSEKAGNGIGKTAEFRIVTVVRDVLVHDPPQAFDQIEMRRVRRQEMQPDAAIGAAQPVFEQVRVMIVRIPMNLGT